MIDVISIKKKLEKTTTYREIRIYKDQQSPEIFALIEMGILKKYNRSSFSKSETYNSLSSFFKKRVEEMDDDFLILARPLEQLNQHEDSKGLSSAIICGGLGVRFTAYSPIAARLLLNGMNVLLFNYRGYGLSEGTPSDQKTVQDLETCFSYLKFTNPNIQNEDILLYANCGGLGAASKIAASYKNLDVIIDRSFPSFNRLVFHLTQDQKKYEGASEIAAKFKAHLFSLGSSFFYSYDNGDSVRKITGNVLMVTDSEDELIPEIERNALKQCMPKTKGKLHQYMTTSVRHSGNWLVGEEQLDVLESFLIQSGKSKIHRQLF